MNNIKRLNTMLFNLNVFFVSVMTVSHMIMVKYSRLHQDVQSSFASAECVWLGGETYLYNHLSRTD